MKKPPDLLLFLLSPMLIVRSTSRPIHEPSSTPSQMSQFLYSHFHLLQLLSILCVKHLPWRLHLSEVQIDVEDKFDVQIYDEDDSGLLQPSSLFGPVQALLKTGTILKGAEAFRTEMMLNEDYGYRFCDRKGGAQPCKLMSDLFAADRIRVHPQQSCTYEPQ